MSPEHFDIEILTPAFVGGAEAKGPAELRVPTLRGQARWWFRALGADRDLEGEVFGAVHGTKPHASCVKFRIVEGTAPSDSYRPLPHSTDPRKKFSRNALKPNHTFRLALFDNPLIRKPRADAFGLACLSVRTWILLGGMGSRANRGGGSVWPSEAPATVDALRERLTALRGEARQYGLWTPSSRIGQAVVDVLEESFDDPEKARIVCTDTVVTPDGELGFVDHQARQASPLKVKVVRLDGEAKPWHILRVGFPFECHRNSAGIDILRVSGKRLGGSGRPLLA